ncbi:hypothetical protein ACFL5N_02665, partial [bacterium]
MNALLGKPLINTRNAIRDSGLLDTAEVKDLQAGIRSLNLKNWKVKIEETKEIFAEVQLYEGTEQDGSQITLKINSDMALALKRTKKIVGLGNYNELVKQMVQHEWMEFQEIQKGEEKSKAHNTAKELAGEKQRALIDVMPDIDYLQGVKEFKNSEDLGRFWDSLGRIKRAYEVIKEGEVNIVEVLNQFKEAKTAYTKFIVNRGEKAREIVISLKEVRGRDVGILLTNLGLLDSGKLKDKLRIVFVGDTMNLSIEKDTLAAFEIIKRLKKVITSEVFWVGGNLSLDKLKTDETDIGKGIRDLAKNGIFKAAHRLYTGHLLSGSGYISKQVQDQVKKLRGRVDEGEIEEVLNSLVKFIGQNGVDVSKMDVNKVSKENAKKIVALFWMIYEQNGILKTNKLDKKLNIKQIALGVDVTIDKDLTKLQKEIVNKKEDKKEDKKVKMLRLVEDGMVIGEELAASEMKKQKDVEKLKLDNVNLVGQQRVDLGLVKGRDLVVMKIISVADSVGRTIKDALKIDQML